MTRQGTDPRPRWRAAAAAALALVALALALAPQNAGAKVPRSFWGVAPQTSLDATDYARMGKGKVGTLRISVFWSVLDPGPAQDDINWAEIDATIGSAAENGMKVLPTLFGTPAWVARDLDGRNCQPARCALFPPKSAAAIAEWKGFIGEFIDRYGRQGTFWSDPNTTAPKVPIDVVQAWNEQNSSKFYLPKANPKAYSKLLGATADAVRSNDASVKVLVGGMAQLAGSKKALAGSEYLENLYDVKGVKDDFDGVSIHPYGASLNKVAAQVELFRDVIKKAHDSKAELWITEVGAGSKNGGHPLNRGLDGQADLLTDIFKYAKKKRNAFNIENVDWFSWEDNTVAFCDWCKSSGLFKIGLVPKPAWRAFTKFTGGS